MSTSTTGAPPVAPGGYYVASRTGSVYYFPWCAAAQKLGQGSLVWFPSEAAAQKAGYRPAKNCKGLATGAEDATIAR